MKNILFAVALTCSCDAQLHHYVQDAGPAPTDGRIQDPPATWHDAFVGLMGAWCVYAERCDPTGFSFSFGSDVGACVDFEVDDLCALYQGAAGCAALYDQTLYNQYTVCTEACGEGSQADCSLWPDWTPACDAALVY